MGKGIIYMMSTVVPGLIKIGKTGSGNFEQRMHELEHNGYRNVTGLKREFAIEVDEYDNKEKLVHKIFEKSRVGDTELFATDIVIAKQLLASFEGTEIYPKTETKEEVFKEATEQYQSEFIPDGRYTLTRTKKSDGNKKINAIAIIENGEWTLVQGSVLGITENPGVSKKAKSFRAGLNIDSEGVLQEDTSLGKCTPSFAGSVVMNASNDGWLDWKDLHGEAVDKYRASKEEE